MKIVFMGTPDFAVPTLSELVMGGHEVIAVYTRAPKPAGRGQELRPSPVHKAAEAFGIPVFTPRNFRDQADIDTFAALGAEAGVVVAYGLLLPKPILDAPEYGCLNLHGSKLPRWRGAAPIQRAIMAGDTRTAATVMKMDEGLDTGPVALLEEIPIPPEMTAGELHDEMMRRGADLMGRALAALARGGLDFTPQSEDGVAYAKKIEKAEARIDFARPAAQVHDHIRGLSPFPGAFCTLARDGRPVRLKVLRATPVAGEGAPGTVLEGLTIACGQGAIRFDLVQREGKGAMDAAAFLRGTGDLTGAVLG